MAFKGINTLFAVKEYLHKKPQKPKKAFKSGSK
jgi:hypothetical protein